MLNKYEFKSIGDRMNDKIRRIEKLLNEQNVRLTSRRKDVLNIFLSHEEHLRAEDIYSLLKHTGIGFATVYRTIELLEKAGIIQEVMIDKVMYYELSMFSEKCFHVHFKCEKCKEVFDCDDLQLGLDIIGLRNYTEKTYNIEVNEVTIVMQGICEKCRTEIKE